MAMEPERDKHPVLHPAFGWGLLASVGVGFATGAAANAMGNAGSYGAWLFVFVPTLMGIAGACGDNFVALRPRKDGFLLSLAVYVLVTVGLMALRYEGLLCILMAAPLYFPLYWTGYFPARGIIRHYKEGPTVFVSLVPLLAGATVVYARVAPPEETFTQTTALDIDAPPEAIWPLLFEMPAIPPPNTIPFRLGVAHPVAIASSGRTKGSRRECRLSTGIMPEIIEVAEPNRRLRFRVLQTPDAMREINPFGPVHPAHLRGHFTVQRGEFRLIPLRDGRTRLVGTSRYALRLAPAAYWNLWADRVVDGVHLTVMGEIKRRVELRR